MSNRVFYQSHACAGFRAKVTIEWDIPAKAEEVDLKGRIALAEDIADQILAFSGKRMRDMVQVMRGYSILSTQREIPMLERDEFDKIADAQNFYDPREAEDYAAKLRNAAHPSTDREPALSCGRKGAAP